MTLLRCHWVTTDEEYIAYHDKEWGKAEKDSQRLFEMLCLEGQQAGLSWYTILKKRAGYRDCFYQFDPVVIAKMTQQDVDRLMQEPRIVRNRLKINAIITNAQAYLTMIQSGEDFSQFLWQFVDGKTQINHWQHQSEIPTHTVISKHLSLALKKRGFKFVGSTICYAFMQATGMVNDHLSNCICRQKKTSNKNIIMINL